MDCVKVYREVYLGYEEGAEFFLEIRQFLLQTYTFVLAISFAP